MIAHKDRTAAGVGAVVLAELRRPVEHRVLRRGGRFSIHHAVIIFVRAERRPDPGHRLIRALRRFFERHSDCLRRIRHSVGHFLYAGIPVPGHGVAEARSRRKHRRAGIVGIDAAAGIVVHEEHVGIGRRHGKRDRHRLLLDEVEVIDRGNDVRIAVQHFDGDGLPCLVGIERHSHALDICAALAADVRSVAARGGVLRRHRRRRGRVGDLHVIVRYIAVEGDPGATGVGKRECFPVGGDRKALEMQAADKEERVVLIVSGTAARFGRAQRQRAGGAAGLDKVVEPRCTAAADGGGDGRFLDAVDKAGGIFHVVVDGRHGIAAGCGCLGVHAADRVRDHIAHAVRTGRERRFRLELVPGGGRQIVKECRGRDRVRRYGRGRFHGETVRSRKHSGGVVPHILRRDAGIGASRDECIAPVR